MNDGRADAREEAGPPRLRVGSTVTVLRPGQGGCEIKGSAAVLLAWVALEGHADRRRLSAVLWPDSDPAQARSNLRVLVHRVNQGFGGELLVGAERLTLNAGLAQVEWPDAEAVLTALAAGGAARCELLAEAGVEAHAGEDLTAWLAGARQRLKRAQLTQLGDALGEALAVTRQAQARAQALARARVQLDPLCEQGHRRLMEVLVHTGDPAAALSAYEDCKAQLRRHLGVLPGELTRRLQSRILQEQAAGGAPGGQRSPEAPAAPPSASTGLLQAALRHWLESLADAGVRVLVSDEMQYALRRRKPRSRPCCKARPLPTNPRRPA